MRQQLASVLEMPIGNIKIVAMEMGGGFGAKLRLALEAFPALLAMKTHRPVKLVNTREETFTLNGPRLETNIYLKTAVTNDGRITAREGRSVFDVGAYLGAGPNSGWGTGWEPTIFRTSGCGHTGYTPTSCTSVPTAPRASPT